MIDLSEVIMIVEVMSPGEWMTTKEIAAKIADDFDEKIGYKVTQNYLQSILKSVSEYDPSSYKYRLSEKRSSTDFNKYQLARISDYLAPLQVLVKGEKTNIELHESVTTKSLVDAIVAISFEDPKSRILKKVNVKLYNYLMNE